MKKEEFIKYSISYIESRIQQVDNKANVLIAIQAGLFAIITWVSEKLFMSNEHLVIPSKIIILISAIFAATIVGFLLRALRPTKTYFSNKTTASRNHWSSKGIMWPRNNKSLTSENFKKVLAGIDAKTIISELGSTLFVGRQLVVEKYRAYRYAVLLTKIEILIAFTGISVLVFLSLCCV